MLYTKNPNSLDNVNNSSDHISVWTVIILISFNPILTFINTITNIFIYQGFVYDTLILYLILIVLLLKATFQTFKNLNSQLLNIILIYASIFVFTFLFLPENFRAAFTSLDNFIGSPLFYAIFSFIGYLIILQIRSLDNLFFGIIKMSKIIIPISIINYFLLLNKGISSSYMVISYDSLLFIVIAIFSSLQLGDRKLGVLGIVGILFILFLGARGPIVSLSFALLIFLVFGRFSKTKKIIIGLLFVFTVIAMYSNFNKTITDLDNSLNKAGIQSRNLNLYLEGRLSYDSGRSDIQKVLINNTTILGHGIFGDRATLVYAHNLFIEIFYQWGFIIGFILSVWIVLLIYNGLKTKNNNLKFLIIAFLSAGFFKLQFSGSYLTEINFYILIALCQRSRAVSYNYGKKLVTL